MTADSQYGDSAPKNKRNDFGLTRKQRECLCYLRQEIDRTGITPSYEEIMHYMGLRSKSGVYRLIHALRDRGKIQFRDAKARSIRILDAPQPVADAIERVLTSCCLTSQTSAELRAILGAEN